MTLQTNQLETAVVRFSRLDDEARLDPEFYQQRYLQEENALSHCLLTTIGAFASVADGPHGYHEVDERSAIAMLTAKNADNWFARRDDAETVADWVVKKNARSRLQAKDIILSTRGTVGMCSLVVEEVLPAIIDQDLARISWSDHSDIRPEYLLCYLQSRFGQDHVRRHSTGMVQRGMSLAKVRAIPVPRAGGDLQQAVATVVNAALNCRRESNAAMAMAERLLLDSIGFAPWAPSRALNYQQPFSEVRVAGRLDSQYFHPRYEQLTRMLSAQSGAAPLASVLDVIVRGKQPVYGTHGLPVLNSRHIRANKIVADEARVAAAHGDTVIHAGDVLLNGTGVGTIGRAAPYLNRSPSLPDNHVTILRGKTIDPVFLSVFLNSPLGQLQIDRHTRGSSGQVELYPSDVAKIIIWNAPGQLQEAVRQMVERSHAFQDGASKRLAVAARAVEVAIEQDEGSGVALLGATGGHA
ncbi:MAG: restriction endonuclease subunit S [Chloroflexi bacterium]|nr:restriction endonuclease subunit S [Chloroflexota bacterium]